MSWMVNEDCYRRIHETYRGYRLHGASAYASFLSAFLIALGTIFLKFESTSWQWVLRNRKILFPHIVPEQPRFANLMRYVLQGIWLISIYPQRKKIFAIHFLHRFKLIKKAYYNWIKSLPQKIEDNRGWRKNVRFFYRLNKTTQNFLFWFISLIAMILAVVCITQPFKPEAQFIFLIILWLTALSVRNIPKPATIIFLVVLSLLVSFRYLWWRYTNTLYWGDLPSLILGLLFLFAETYIWIMLTFSNIQSIWPLHRTPIALPEDRSTWPTVDIMITTYTEDLNIIRPGVYASLGMDWPKEKLNIYILDDGDRQTIKDFAEQVGVHYIARKTHEHAKAGNINHALKLTKGEYIAFFDCDHIPVRTFLQVTLGWFLKDPKLAILQTPQHFFSPDPFERNLGIYGVSPKESALFYGIVQDGNDTWNATYFCGSSGVIRRNIIEEIGGMAVESVTEDLETTLKLQRLGYNTAYLRIPLAAGLATESLSVFIKQRIRWARGTIQVFRMNNPLTGKGLTIMQRLCYTCAILYFLAGIPRLILFSMPVFFLLFNVYIIYASPLMLLLYAFPHIAHTLLASTSIQGKYRHFLWNEIYETVVSWYIAVPTTLALINPKKGAFNVTAKGGLIEETYMDWASTRPYVILLIFNFAGLLGGIWRLSYGISEEIPGLIISMIWILNNLMTLGGAFGVAIEAKQTRKSPRVNFSMPCSIINDQGYSIPCTLIDYSDIGVGVEMLETHQLQKGEKVSLILSQLQEDFSFPCDIVFISKSKIGLRLENLSLKENINFIQCTFARSDAWANWQNGFAPDQPKETFRDIIKMEFNGYRKLIQYTPFLIRNFLNLMINFLVWIFSVLPHPIKISQKKRILEC